MIRILLIVQLIFFSLASIASENFFVAMTYNVRVPIDSAPLDWVHRKSALIDIIKTHEPDFLGLQEAVPDVVSDVSLQLRGYKHFGRGRDVEGMGEAVPIFYRSSRWVVDRSDYGSRQISPTPEIIGSNGWGFQWPRMYTWGKFKDRRTGRLLYVFNTHFPLRVEEREKSMQVLMAAIMGRSDLSVPVLLLGDFNACIEESSLKWVVESNAMLQFRDVLSDYRGDVKYTFHEFGRVQGGCPIDHIFYSNGLALSSVAIDSQVSAISASDHFPVIATMGFNK